MKEVFEQYAAYNLWANEKLLNVVLPLDEKLQQQTIESSFSSLHSTFLHIWHAESVWWQRLKLQEQVIAPGAVTKPGMKEIADGLLNQSKQWNDWVKNATPAAIEHVFAYYNSKKEYFKNPVWKTLLHLFNHGTYYRGQAVTILHNIGIKKIPTTDFISFTRKK